MKVEIHDRIPEDCSCAETRNRLSRKEFSANEGKTLRASGPLFEFWQCKKVAKEISEPEK